MSVFGKLSHDLSNSTHVLALTFLNLSEVELTVFGGFDDMLNNQFIELLFSDLFAGDTDESLVFVKLLVDINRSLISSLISNILVVVLHLFIGQE
jgi:hypothetical protein